MASTLEATHNDMRVDMKGEQHMTWYARWVPPTAMFTNLLPVENVTLLLGVIMLRHSRTWRDILEHRERH